MDYTIRLEEEKDFRITEEITREAYWNLYVPGCNEHLIVHNMRSSPAFIPELNFVICLNDQVIGSIYYTKSKIIALSGEEIETITFGPVSILPKYQNMGFGKALIKHSINVAREMDFPAILIYGFPDYYYKFGFRSVKYFNICREDGKFPRALLILTLSDEILKGIGGRLIMGYDFASDAQELITFDSTFEPKQKIEGADTQKKFGEMSTLFD